MQATAFDVYGRYIALKNHFTSDYDYFKYSGKTSAKPSSLEKRRDKYYFSKLARNKNYEDILLANFVERKDAWIGELVESEAEDVYKRWKKKIESLSYVFKNDLSKLDDDFKSNFICKDGQHPRLLTLHLHGDISLETLVILDSMLKFSNGWNEKIREHYVWPVVHLKLKKYRPFLSYDKAKMKEIFLKEVS